MRSVYADKSKRSSWVAQQSPSELEKSYLFGERAYAEVLLKMG
jgi:hypothetical protein